MKLKGLARVDRPREKLQKYGPKKLADHELLAIVLGSGVKGVNVLELSKQILKLLKQTKKEGHTIELLRKVKGLGSAKAAQVMAVLELAHRFTGNEMRDIESAKDVWSLCVDIRDSKREHLVAFYLDTGRRVIERRIISVGILDQSLVHPREVFEPALSLQASSVIIAHNHPSGNIEASQADKEVTKQLIHAGKILGIELGDHVIVTKDAWKSILEGIYE